MSSKFFLQKLQDKLKGGNARSIHLNALPGRLATRMDVKQLDLIEAGLSGRFLDILLSKPNVEFTVTFDNVDLNKYTIEEQKRLGVIAKRLNSIIIENEDYYKEHGVKTLGFGYPILVRRSSKDPSKIIKAPLFIWPLDALKSKVKVNEWSFLRNKVVHSSKGLVDSDIHSVEINEVLLSFIKGEDNITLPGFDGDVLDDMLIDKDELLLSCANVLSALNPGTLQEHLDILKHKFEQPIVPLPDAAEIDAIANNKAYIHFGGVFGLFRAQKESIINDITKLLDRFDEFEFDNLKVENVSDTPFSAVSTDPTQQAIISTLGLYSNQIIQGPPGTGKSQSLTALVTNALANGLKCLVVCEKKTALDVIKSNIERAHPQMAHLVAVIDDVNEDREAIVDSVRDRQTIALDQLQLSQASSQYHAVIEKISEVTTTINLQHLSLAAPIYDGETWGRLVGRFLSLKKNFNSIPLRNVLRKEDFLLVQQHAELNAVLGSLAKASHLFVASRQIHDAMAKIEDSVFVERTLGDSRMIIEDFIDHGREVIPKLKEVLESGVAESRTWSTSVYDDFPRAIKNEFRDYLPFLMGEAVQSRELPNKFALEEELAEAMAKLEQLKESAMELKASYQHKLREHYAFYQQELNIVLSSNEQFIKENLTAHGAFFLSNSTGAKIKTNVLGLFSKRYRELKKARLQLKEKIVDVRSVHQKKEYIVHEYNDHLQTIDLSIYVDNIKSLASKLEDWGEGTQVRILDYTDKISVEHFHPEFQEVKKQATEMLINYWNTTSDLKSKYELLDKDDLVEINQLIAYLPTVIEKLANHLQSFKIFNQFHADRSKLYHHIQESFKAIEAPNGTNVCTGLYKNYGDLREAVAQATSIAGTIEVMSSEMNAFRAYHEWRSYFLGCSPLFQLLIRLSWENSEGSWENAFECWYLFWLLSLNEPQQLPKGDYDIQLYRKLKREFDQAQLTSLIGRWREKQAASVRALRSSSISINSLFNKKGAKGMRRNSLRYIIKNQFPLFTDFFPVILLNPSVCSSIIPLEEGIFDIVIFDEASQLRLEDTYASLIRGKAKIVSGDKHQMAPSSYFEGSGALLDPLDGEDDGDDEVDENLAVKKSDQSLAESESLLAFAVDKNFRESYLTVHYRSQHPHLIDFSNHAFYGKRLIPVPAQKDYVPIEFIQVNGVYENQTNRAEALQVVFILRERVSPDENGDYPSVGVATFNLYQRNLILEEIGSARRESVAFDSLMSALGDSFFVKNLENIQGDERDIIILSNTFGRKVDGSFSQQFGPIIQGKGHRMLNVIITRAKQKVFVCNSFPEEFIGQYAQLIAEKGNRGRAILYAYLSYARAVSEGKEEQRKGILNLLSQYCTDKLYSANENGLGSESPFEEEVYARLSQYIDPLRLEQQYEVGGFRVDIVVHPKTAAGRKIAIECDGAKYHSSPEAYAWDVFRQEQLEKFGFVFHRIWSTKWWDSADIELDSLLAFINEQDKMIRSGLSENS